MASNSSSSPPPGTGTPFDPLNQTSFLLFADGQTQIPFSTYNVTQIYIQATSLSILYGTQIGVCFMMLAVVLAMTPRVRFKRLPTMISIAALTINLVRMVLLAVFFTTSWVDLYVIVSQDAGVVPRSDFDISATATILSVPVTMLILAALCVQAWSMLRLWSMLYKLPAALVSLVLVLATVTFNMMTTIIQTRAILYADISQLADWVRQAYLALITASICWFCFLFNIRLVMHMWTNRSILPSLKGLKAMDVLVITNGILMFVPVVFAALKFGEWQRFEPGSLTQTSVLTVLPLGTLVAQRLANPGWFNSEHGAGGRGGGGRGGGGGSANSTGTGLTSSQISRGGMSTATTAKRPLLMSVRSNESGGGGVHRGSGRAAVSTHIAAASDGSVMSEKGRAVHADGEEDGRDLAPAISGADLERGVRVDYGIERREERLPTGGS
ncbi:fungal pheromone mating factor STE2 GPCR-domain-containing protein [Chaetomidium leptoderma]|uniref:Fungal pheromone mating factor STE2 GPCR-domain-containing protein n=1 Tax=Chaetomidium leptoderma TaxID=669021 RepID=A0AAN6VHN4_9PEZI|nr:fungal pheromone mating factor STE2 GPCR-domain-containing protein [Chaetomidium leptoderma]